MESQLTRRKNIFFILYVVLIVHTLRMDVLWKPYANEWFIWRRIFNLSDRFRDFIQFRTLSVNIVIDYINQILISLGFILHRKSFLIDVHNFILGTGLTIDCLPPLCWTLWKTLHKGTIEGLTKELIHKAEPLWVFASFTRDNIISNFTDIYRATGLNK